MSDAKNLKSTETALERSRFAKHLSGVAEIDFDYVLAVLRRQRRTIIAATVGGVAAAFVYTVVAQPTYTSMAQILIEGQKVKALTDLAESNALLVDTGSVDSQVSVLESERITLAVIKKLDLKNEPVFNRPPWILTQVTKSAIDAIRDTLGLTDPKEQALLAAEADHTLERRLVTTLGRQLEVKRIGRSFVIELKYTADTAGLSAKIANAFAEQYLVDQLDAKFDATSRAAVWLQDRISELRGKVLAADTKVQKFRADNGLIAVDGRLIDEQQLTNANTKLSDARSKLAEADARVASIDSIIQSGSVDGAVTESLTTSVVAQLRTKYLEASKREAEITKRLGSAHIAAVNLRSEMTQYEKLLFEELGRIGESYRSDARIARANVESLEANLRKQLEQTSTNNQTLVALRELEREADTYKTLYQSFLQRYQEAIQQQSFPINDARVITAASPPISPSWPRKPLILGGGLVLGALAGVGAAFARELRDRVFRTGNQIETELGVEFLGILPLVNEKDESGGRRRTALNYVLSDPLSGFAETLRATKVAADIALRGKTPKVIGIVSVLPGEGKTTVSKNFASLLAAHGSKTVLVDADFRRPGLSRAIAREATSGLVEVLAGKRTLQDVAIREEESGLSIIPAIVDANSAGIADLLSSDRMRDVLDRLGSSHDYVVLDLPPIGPVTDVRAASDLFDAFVLVVEWGATSRTLVRNTLDVEAEIAEKCLGVILNKVDKQQISLYDGAEYRNYYHSAYSGYYRS